MQEPSWLEVKEGRNGRAETTSGRAQREKEGEGERERGSVGPREVALGRSDFRAALAE